MTRTPPSPETVAEPPDPRPSAQPQPSRRLRLLCYLTPHPEGTLLHPRAVCDPDGLVRGGFAEWVGGEPSGQVSDDAAEQPGA